MKVTPLKYHAPGFRIEMPDGDEVIVWAPGQIMHDTIPQDRIRDYWQVSWDNETGTVGNCVKATTFDEAFDTCLATYPNPVRVARFRAASARAMRDIRFGDSDRESGRDNRP